MSKITKMKSFTKSNKKALKIQNESKFLLYIMYFIDFLLLFN